MNKRKKKVSHLEVFKELQIVKKQYRENYNLLLKSVGTDKHKEYLKKENELNRLNYKLLTKLEIN